LNHFQNDIFQLISNHNPLKLKKLKGLVHFKIKMRSSFVSNLFFPLLNTKEDILKNVVNLTVDVTPLTSIAGQKKTGSQ